MRVEKAFGRGMAQRLDLGDHVDAIAMSVLDQLGHLIHIQRQRVQRPQLIGLIADGVQLVVIDAPDDEIQLEDGADAHDALDLRQRVGRAPRVDHEASPRVTGPIHDLDARQAQLARGAANQLAERHGAPEQPSRRRCLDRCLILGYLETIALVTPNRHVSLSGGRHATAQAKTKRFAILWLHGESHAMLLLHKVRQPTGSGYGLRRVGRRHRDPCARCQGQRHAGQSRLARLGQQ